MKEIKVGDRVRVVDPAPWQFRGIEDTVTSVYSHGTVGQIETGFRFHASELELVREPNFDDSCLECGGDLSDGEGYDGLCGSCADRAEAAGVWRA